VTEAADTINADADVKIVASMVLAEGIDAASISAQLLSYIVILTSLAEEGQRITAVPDLEVGWWLEVGPVVTGGTIADVVVNQDGTFEVAEGVASFEVRVWNGSSWGVYGTQHVFDPLTVVLAVTEVADTGLFNASNQVIGSLAVTEDVDTLSADIDVRIAASLAVAEGSDSASAAADIRVSVSLIASEAADALSADAEVRILVSMGVTEAADTAAFNASNRVIASLAVTEGSDGFAGSAVVVVTSLLAVTEGVDNFSAQTYARNAVLTVSEAADSVSAGVDVRVSASLAVSEGSDEVSAIAGRYTFASLLVTEGSDGFSADVEHMEVQASVSVVESSDIVAISAQLLSYIVVLTSLAEAEHRITAIPDLEVGWWLEVGPVVTGGTIVDVSVNQDGTFDVDADVTSFQVRAWNGVSWGAYGTEYTYENIEATLSVIEGADTMFASTLPPQDSTVVIELQGMYLDTIFLVGSESAY
jgi:hypothetical protein